MGPCKLAEDLHGWLYYTHPKMTELEPEVMMVWFRCFSLEPRGFQTLRCPAVHLPGCNPDKSKYQGALMNDYDVVAKISIVPRGPAGGVTIFMPSEERLNSGLYSKELFLEPEGIEV